MLRQLERLQYLKEPNFANYSAEVFSSSARLPILGMVLELTRIPEEDTFYARQITSFLDLDSGNTARELAKVARQSMIGRCPVVKNSGSIINYFRTTSPRWDIIEIAVKSARSELGI